MHKKHNIIKSPLINGNNDGDLLFIHSETRDIGHSNDISRANRITAQKERELHHPHCLEIFQELAAAYPRRAFSPK